LCWRTEFFPKHPGDEGTDWHQVDTWVDETGDPHLVWPAASDFGGTLTAWTAFTDTDTETACMQVIPGTHQTMFYDETRNLHYDPNRINKLEKDGVRSGFFGYDFRERQKDPNWSPDLSKAVPLPMKAGECILFWSTLMHASHPHLGKTQVMRMGFSARYVPTSVRVYPNADRIIEFGGTVSLARHGVVIVAGKDEYKHNRVAMQMLTGEPFPANRRY
jgi:non-heme Fe2+,alpha-ketoglutarate-dependent halogenase